MRTEQEITRQLQARYMELEREASLPTVVHPCTTCEWRSKSYRCFHPLIKGFGSAPYCGATETLLCGPEKALWEQRRGWLVRIADWFIAPWRDAT